MCRPLSFGAVIGLVMIAGRLAAAPAVSSVEQAQQLAPAFPPAPDTPHADSDLPASAAGDPDDDSFGCQQILKGVNRIPPFDAFASLSALFTNNVAMTHRDTHSDAFLVATFGLSTTHNITDRLSLNLTAGASLFRYARFDGFDMDSLDTGAGLAYQMPKLWDSSLFVRYSFSDLLTDRSYREFYENHDFTLGVEKNFGLSRALSLTAGFDADFNLSDPVDLQQDSVGAYAGIEAALTSRLQADLYYRFAYQCYTEGKRRDENHLLTLSLQYKIANWFSIVGTTYFTVNQSNEEVYSYEELVDGLGVSANIAF